MVSGLIELLGEILGIDGVQMAALVDAGTGMMLGAVGVPARAVPAGAAPAGADLAAVAAGLAEEARAVARVAAAGDGGLEEFTAVTASRFQLVKVLDAHPGESMLLLVDADRARTNMALAALRVGQAAPVLLA